MSTITFSNATVNEVIGTLLSNNKPYIFTLTRVRSNEYTIYINASKIPHKREDWLTKILTFDLNRILFYDLTNILTYDLTDILTGKYNLKKKYCYTGSKEDIFNILVSYFNIKNEDIQNLFDKF